MVLFVYDKVKQIYLARTCPMWR